MPAQTPARPATSLWTGMNPAKTGVTRFEHLLAPEARMPAEILKEAGFRTVGLFRNGWVEGYHGFDQGFDTYVRPLGRGVSREVRRENPTIKGSNTDDDAVTAAIEFLRVQGDERGDQASRPHFASPWRPRYRERP